MKVESRKWCC